jgi:hypothetical protein
MCGATSRKGKYWGSNAMDESTVEICYDDRLGCEDGGASQKTFADMCPHCFMTKLVPWLQTQGVSMQHEEADW